MVGVLFVGWLCGLIVVPLATRLTRTIRFHADVAAAVVIDALMAATVTLGVTGALVLIAASEEHYKFGAPQVLLLCTIPVSAIAVRLGSLAAFGVGHSRRLTYYSQILAGGFCGLAVYQWTAIAFGKIADSPVNVGWLWTLLTGFGLAGGFAQIDQDEKRNRWSGVPRA